MYIPIIFFVETRSRLIELSRELNASVLSVKKDHLAQVNLWAPFLYSERDTIIILVLDLCQRNFSCSYFRFSTKVVNWVIFHGLLWFGWCRHKRAQSLVSALVYSYLSPHYHESSVCSVPRVLRSLRIPDTADLYCCSLWPNTTFIPNHQWRPGKHGIEDTSWVCLDNSVPEPLLSHIHPSSLWGRVLPSAIWSYSHCEVCVLLC